MVGVALVSLQSMLSQPVTLYTRAPGGPDEYGDPSEVETAHTVQGLLGRQSQATESAGGFEQETDVRSLWLDPSAPLDGWSRVEVNGQSWEVVGPPWQGVNPRTGTPWYVRANVRARTHQEISS